MIRMNIQLFGGGGGGGRGGGGAGGARNTPSGMDARDFAAANDAQATDLLDRARNATLPSTMHDSITQRVINELGITEKPEFISDAKLRALVAEGQMPIYRTYRTNIFGVTGDEVMRNAMSSDENNIGGWGGQAYGGGHYFSNSHSGSTAYGGAGVNGTLGAVFNSKARVVTYSQLERMAGNFVNQFPNLSSALGITPNYIPTRSVSVMAIKLGYNAIQHGSGNPGDDTYYTIINRGILTTSRTNYYTNPLGDRN